MNGATKAPSENKSLCLHFTSTKGNLENRINTRSRIYIVVYKSLTRLKRKRRSNLLSLFMLSFTKVVKVLTSFEDLTLHFCLLTSKFIFLLPLGEVTLIDFGCHFIFFNFSWANTTLETRFMFMLFLNVFYLILYWILRRFSVFFLFFLFCFVFSYKLHTIMVLEHFTSTKGNLENKINTRLKRKGRSNLLSLFMLSFTKVGKLKLKV